MFSMIVNKILKNLSYFINYFSCILCEFPITSNLYQLDNFAKFHFFNKINPQIILLLNPWIQKSHIWMLLLINIIISHKQNTNKQNIKILKYMLETNYCFQWLFFLFEQNTILVCYILFDYLKFVDICNINSFVKDLIIILDF
jgi:hypothetical protein